MVRQTAQPRGEDQEREAQDAPTTTESSGSQPKPRKNSFPDSPSLDPLAQFSWYHGSIPREEAQCRLEQSGANDG